MIDTSVLWYESYLKKHGATPLEWLSNLAALVAEILAADPQRATPGRVEEGAKIVGSVVFGKNCVVGHGALVVGPAIFGDDCVVGHAAEVTRSIFGNDTRAAHLNYVGDSVLGSGVNLGAGVKLANTRFDKAPINNLPHCGAFIGDHCQIGCNAVLDPGVELAAHSWFHGTHLPRGNYDRESVKKYFYS